jgi:hypothetical protein
METFMIIVLVLSLLGMLFVKDIAGISTCGWPKSDWEYLEIIEKMKTKNIQLINDMGTKGFITCLTPGIPFISGSITGITFGYYVNGYGIVPRWYKSHKEITKIFKKLENK